MGGLCGPFWSAFSDPCFGRASGPHFDDFGPLLGSLLETILVTFGVPFLHRFSKDFGGSPEVNIQVGVVAI